MSYFIGNCLLVTRVITSLTNLRMDVNTIMASRHSIWTIPGGNFNSGMCDRYVSWLCSHKLARHAYGYSGHDRRLIPQHLGFTSNASHSEYNARYSCLRFFDHHHRVVGASTTEHGQSDFHPVHQRCGWNSTGLSLVIGQISAIYGCICMCQLRIAASIHAKLINRLRCGSTHV